MSTHTFSFIRYLLAVCLFILVISCGSNKKSGAETIDKFKVKQLLEKNTCFVCHKQNERLVGPSYLDIAKRNYSDERIVELIYKPEPENWPDYPAPMIGLPHLDKSELLEIARWINSLE